MFGLIKKFSHHFSLFWLNRAGFPCSLQQSHLFPFRRHGVTPQAALFIALLRVFFSLLFFPVYYAAPIWIAIARSCPILPIWLDSNLQITYCHGVTR